MQREMSAALSLTDRTFRQEVLESPGMVLVDLWSKYSVPSRWLAPAINELADEFRDRAKVCRLEVETNPVTAEQFGVRQTPVVLLFYSGRLVDLYHGWVEKKELRGRLATLLKVVGVS